MKTIAILAEQVSDRSLAAVLPARGVASVSISRNFTPRRAGAGDVYAFRNPARFAPSVRIDVVIEDDAVDTLFDGISFAYGAGLFSDAEAWIDEPVALAA